MRAIYVGLDWHEKATVLAAYDASGSLVSEAVLPTTLPALRRELRGIRGRKFVALEEGALARWISTGIAGVTENVLVCNAARIARTAGANKADRIDARRLARLLRLGELTPVYQAPTDVFELRQLMRYYDQLVHDHVRLMARTRAIFARCGIFIRPLPRVRRDRERVLRRLVSPAACRHARENFLELDRLAVRRQQARQAFIRSAEVDPRFGLLKTLPNVGDIRAAMLLAIVGDPRRFPNKKRFQAYGGLALRIHASAEYDGRAARRDTAPRTRGLTRNRNPELKRVLCDIALGVTRYGGAFQKVYHTAIHRGLSRAIARVVLARKIASVIFSILKSGQPFDPDRLEYDRGRRGRASDV